MNAARRPSTTRTRRRSEATPASLGTATAPAQSELGTRLKSILPVIVIPALTAAALVAILVLVLMLLSGADLVGVPAAIASGWLALHGVGVTIGATHLGIVPILPLLVLWLVVASRVHSAAPPRRSFDDVRALAIAAMAVPLLASLIALGVLLDAATVLPIHVPHILGALGLTALVHGLAVGYGLLPWLTEQGYLPGWIARAIRLAVRYVGLLLGIGLIATIGSLVWHYSTLQEIFEVYNGTGGMIAVVGMLLLYLPNSATAAAAILTGADAHAGVTTVSVFGMVPGTLPALPPLAALPQSFAGPIVAAVLVIPALLAGFLAHRLVRAENKQASPTPPVYIVLLAGVVAMVLIFILGYFASGRMGVWGHTGVTPWLFALTGSAWLLLVGGVVALAEGGIPKRRDAAAAAAAGLATDAAEDEQEEIEDTADADGDADADSADEAEGAEDSVDSDEVSESPDSEESGDPDDSGNSVDAVGAEDGAEDDAATHDTEVLAEDAVDAEEPTHHTLTVVPNEDADVVEDPDAAETTDLSAGAADNTDTVTLVDGEPGAGIMATQETAELPAVGEPNPDEDPDSSASRS